jgi:hypothetical protein
MSSPSDSIRNYSNPNTRPRPHGVSNIFRRVGRDPIIPTLADAIAVQDNREKENNSLLKAEKDDLVEILAGQTMDGPYSGRNTLVVYKNGSKAIFEDTGIKAAMMAPEGTKFFVKKSLYNAVEKQSLEKLQKEFAAHIANTNPDKHGFSKFQELVDKGLINPNNYEKIPKPHTYQPKYTTSLPTYTYKLRTGGSRKRHRKTRRRPTKHRKTKRR